jgi:hypothetical protein
MSLVLLSQSLKFDKLPKKCHFKIHSAQELVKFLSERNLLPNQDRMIQEQNNLVPKPIESSENFRNTSPIDVINIDETVLELSENETEKYQAVTTTEKIKAVSKKQKRVVSKKKKVNKKNYFDLSITKEAASKEKVFEDITTLMNEKDFDDLPWFDVKDSPHLAYFSKNEKHLESLVGLEIENSATNGNI